MNVENYQMKKTLNLCIAGGDLKLAASHILNLILNYDWGGRGKKSMKDILKK